MKVFVLLAVIGSLVFAGCGGEQEVAVKPVKAVATAEVQHFDKIDLLRELLAESGSIKALLSESKYDDDKTCGETVPQIQTKITRMSSLLDKLDGIGYNTDRLRISFIKVKSSIDEMDGFCDLM